MFSFMSNFTDKKLYCSTGLPTQWRYSCSSQKISNLILNLILRLGIFKETVSLRFGLSLDLIGLFYRHALSIWLSRITKKLQRMSLRISQWEFLLKSLELIRFYQSSFLFFAAFLLMPLHFNLPVLTLEMFSIKVLPELTS